MEEAAFGPYLPVENGSKITGTSISFSSSASYYYVIISCFQVF